MSVESGMAPSQDGTPIYYEVFGKGRPLIFCNGLLCQRVHWRHQISHFSKKFRVVTFDYRGHSASGFPKNDQHMTLEWCARDALSVAKALSLTEAVLLGHSMGVSVVARAALLNPSIVKALVFVCGGVTNPFRTMFFTDRMDSIYRVSDRLFQWAPDLMTKVWKRLTKYSGLSRFLTAQLGFNALIADEQDIRMYIEGVHRNRLDTFYGLLRDYTKDEDTAWLKPIRCPVLVVAGEDDCVTPVDSLTSIRERISHAEFEKVAGGSHNAHADLPLVVNRRVERFLDEIGYS